jgi:uncharacterized small protein (DUF1192 family)
MIIDKADALLSLRKGAEWLLTDDELEWLDTNQTQPTDAEIATEITRLQAEYDSQQYARDRAEAYPSLTDQADMAYWDRQNGTTTLDDAITAVKSAYPKT